MDDGAIVFAASVINIFTDILVTALPMPLIWSLKLPTRQRLAVISIFGLGVVVNVAGCVRTVYVWKSLMTGYDGTWVGWPGLITAAVELSLGLVRGPTASLLEMFNANNQQICSSAPALRPLLAAFLPRLLSSSRNIGASYSQRNRTHRLWYSTGRSRASRLATDEAHPPGYSNDRVEIMRTVEMESWVESRLTSHDKMGHGYDITFDSHGRAFNPVDDVDMKMGMFYASPTSSGSSASRPSDTHPPFDDRQSR